jgi:hypothetical protein
MTIEVGKPLPYFCPACQAFPQAGYCKLAGCPTSPAENSLSGAQRSELSTLPGMNTHADLISRIEQLQAENAGLEQTCTALHSTGELLCAKLTTAEALSTSYRRALAGIARPLGNEPDSALDRMYYWRELAIESRVIARQALSPEPLEEGLGLSRSQPSGAGPTVHADPQSQHSDGGR